MTISTRTFKKWSLVLLALMMSMFLLAGCGNDKKEAVPAPAKKTIVVSTGFVNDMVHQLSGDTFNVEQLIPNGDDPHVYVPKPQDLEKIKKADLVLYSGLHFEGKLTEPLSKTGYAITSNFPKDKIGEMEEDGKLEQDPHFWFDIDLYKQAVKNVADQLIKLDPSKKADIEANLAKYLKKVDELKDYATKKINEIPKEHRYVITPHDALNYFARQYDLTVKAPLGISTEEESSNKAIEETANFIVEHKVKAIFAEATNDPARMKKLQEVVEAKGWKVKVVSGEGKEILADSLAPKGQKGDNYIDMVKHDVDLISDNLK